MSTRPSFQFYPDDWISNPNLRRCTFAEKGIWLEVMCILHDQDEYGVLRWPLKEIAETVKCRTSELQGLIRKGVLKGDDKALAEPFIYTPRSGRRDGPPVTLLHPQAGPIWYSSRMVKDEYVRTIRAEMSGNGGASKASPKPAPNPPFGEGIGVGFGPRSADTPAAPSSSSSSSPSVNTPSATAHADSVDGVVFAITADWSPGPGLEVQAKLMGAPVKDEAAMAEGLAEFVAYWLTRPGEVRTQAQWENALAKSLKHRQVTGTAQAARQSTTRPAPRQSNHGGHDAVEPA
jgi:hypothetical protein